MKPGNSLINCLAASLIILIILPFLFPLVILFKILNYIQRSYSPENVSGKVVLITGASSGIGEHLAYEYAKKGACLVLASRRKDKLEEVAIKARKLGALDVLIQVTDISKIKDCTRLVEAATNHYGRLDHLVNNAGILQVPMFEDITNFESVASIMEINFWGSVYCTQFALPYLRKSKGKIAVISSSAAWIPIPRFSIYSASKGALVSFFETLRTEVGHDVGITIATPGLVDSEMTRDEMMKAGKMNTAPKQPTEEFAKKLLSSICSGDRFLIDQTDLKIVYLLKQLFPELLDTYHRWVFITKPKTSENSTKNQ